MTRPFTHRVVILGILLSGLHGVHVKAQQLYTNMTAELGITDVVPSTFHFGHGVSVIDYDQDGWDDFVYPIPGQGIIWYRNNGNGFTPQELLPAAGDTKTVLFGDVDNDGDYDVWVVHIDNGYELYIQEPDGLNLILSVDEEDAYGTHASLGDVNGDGLLDIFICNWGAARSPLLINQGNGQFVDEAPERGVIVGNGIISPALASTIIDIDFDGAQDIHVAVDKTPIDGLFIQQADGTFQNVAFEAGMDYIMDSMSSSICDFDHDGDFDIYVTNNTLGNYFYVDQGGLSYTNEASSLGIAVHQYCWGALWVDMNNDTWDDLYVAGEPVLYPALDGVFLNSGDGTFEPVLDFADEFALTNSFSVAKGDFNRDGYYDIVMNPIGAPLQVYYNNGGSNHWLNITLEGTQSNRDGVGALIEYWIDGHRMIRHTAAGDSYLSQNSQHYILGAGDADLIDQLIVHWPSGQVDSLVQIPTNQYLYLLEGDLQWGQWSVESHSALCPGDSVHVSHSEGNSLIWLDGVSGASRVFDQPHFCHAWWLDEAGYIHPMEPLVIQSAEEIEPVIVVHHPSCAGFSDGRAELIAPELWLSIDWSSGSVAPVADSLAAGDLVFTGVTEEGCEVQELLTLAEPLPLEAEFVSVNPLCYDNSDGAVMLQSVMGGTAPYEWQVFSEGEMEWEEESLPAGDFTVQLIDASGCEVQQVMSLVAPDSLGAALTPFEEGFFCNPFGGVPPYVIRWNGWEGQQYSGPLPPGEHVVEVEDSNGCIYSTPLWADVSVIPPDVYDFEECVRRSGSLLHWECGGVPPRWVVFDPQGRLVLHQRNQWIDLSPFGAGLYQIGLVRENGSIMQQRVIVN
jgi:hypothetical protein